LNYSCFEPERPVAVHESRRDEGEMTDPTSASESEKQDALLFAIAKFREDIGRLFDEQIALVRGRSIEPAVPEPTLIAPTVEPLLPPPAAVEVRPAPAAPVEPPVARSNDPRERLDALAKLLDRRLKPTSVDTPSKAAGAG